MSRPIGRVKLTYDVIVNQSGPNEYVVSSFQKVMDEEYQNEKYDSKETTPQPVSNSKKTIMEFETNVQQTGEYEYIVVTTKVNDLTNANEQVELNQEIVNDKPQVNQNDLYDYFKALTNLNKVVDYRNYEQTSQKTF